MHLIPPRALLVLLVLGTTASVGVVLATSSKSPAPRAKALEPGVVDCETLDRLLRTCAVSIAATVDPEVPQHLSRMDPALQGAVVTTIADELQTRVGGACKQQRGRIQGGPQVAACLRIATAAEKAKCPTSGDVAKDGPEGCARWRAGQACEALSSCLKTAFEKLPPPGPPPAEKP